MFEGITEGQTIRIHFTGSTQGLAMRVRYEGFDDVAHHLSGLGVLEGAQMFAYPDGGGWALSNGRALTAVEEV